jgi:exopolysaccharide biosynthesis WecB/TagA/CpsF family protein
MVDYTTLKFVDSDDPNRVVNSVIDDWQQSGKYKIVHYIYYSNFILLGRDPIFYQSMQLSDYIFIDGIGMQLYLKITKGKWVNNLNGTDLNPTFIKAIDERQIPITLYGTTKENIQEAGRKIMNYAKNKSIHYLCDGYSELDWKNLQDKSVLFIGMGSPLQENWVASNLKEIEKRKLLVITVGGFFDFASGFYVRAPKLVRQLKLEWAWRTLLHPKRHLKKRLRDFTIFFRPVIDKLLKRTRNLKILEL